MFRSENAKRRYCPKEFGGQEHKWAIKRGNQDVHYCTNCGYKEIFDKDGRRIK